MKPLDALEVWFFTGSQDLYGEAALEQVARDSAEIVAALDAAPAIPVRIVARPVLRVGRRHRGGDRRGECDRPVHRPHRLDAHLLTGADVDRRAPGTG